MEPDGVRQLAESLRGLRESLIPASAEHAVGDLGGADVEAAAGEFCSQLDVAQLTLAGELDFLQAGADTAATAWEAAEARNTASMRKGER